MESDLDYPEAWDSRTTNSVKSLAAGCIMKWTIAEIVTMPLKQMLKASFKYKVYSP